jgi:hypothetical protein
MTVLHMHPFDVYARIKAGGMPIPTDFSIPVTTHGMDTYTTLLQVQKWPDGTLFVEDTSVPAVSKELV